MDAAKALKSLNGNNNTNLGEEVIYSYYPLKGTSSTGKDKMRIGKKYTDLDTFLEKLSTLEEIQAFLKQFILCLFSSEGYSATVWNNIGSKTIEPLVTGEYCNFLGTKKHSERGCKLTDTNEKLVKYAEYMIGKMITYFTNVPDSLKEKMIADEQTMELFASAIRNFLYFYGQKQVDPPFKNPTSPFLPLIEQINQLFGKRILRIGCKISEYGCGRFVQLTKCDTKDMYYILIYKTEGAYSMNLPTNITGVLETESKACGGRRKKAKTRKMSRKRTTRKN